MKNIVSFVKNKTKTFKPYMFECAAFVTKVAQTE